MNYKQVKLSFTNCELNRFYRTLLVKEDINLVDLGCAILTAFKGAYEHCFLFKTNGINYNPLAFIVEIQMDDDVLMDDYTLKDLGNKFTFVYDTGEYWEFEAIVTLSDIPVRGEDVILIDGAGQGIWEDNIHSLYAYLDGQIGPNSREDNEDLGYTLPWNLDFEKYGDFDKPFDVEKEHKKFLKAYKKDLKIYKQEQETYFKSH